MNGFQPPLTTLGGAVVLRRKKQKNSTLGYGVTRKGGTNVKNLFNKFRQVQ